MTVLSACRRSSGTRATNQDGSLRGFTARLTDCSTTWCQQKNAWRIALPICRTETRRTIENPLFQTVERLFFHAAVSPRWIDEAWPRVRLQPGDLRNQDALNHARGRTAYIPARHSESATYQAVKQFVDAGGQRRATQPCVRENKETWVWVWVSVRAISRFSLSLSV